MSIVSICDADVSKITSGQVIVDLTSVVKELVDNAIDAGCDKVEVTFNNHGAKSVEVSDNGAGIDAADFETLCLKHHTSKLTNFEDLASVATLGFRGEAMSSMCAVAKVKVVTCSASTFPRGTSLEYDSMGKLKNKKTLVTGKKGTSVIVSELFNGIPVRQKNFVKHIKREYAKVLSLLQAYLLAYTSIRFTIFNISGATGKKSMVMGTQGGESTVSDVLTTIYGSNGSYGLIPISISVDDIDARFKLNAASMPVSLSIKLTGVISDCSFGMGRAATDRQYITINRRPITNKKMAKVINELYRSFNATQSPVFVLDLQLDTSLIDVNVTPDKRLIMIQCEDLICEVIREELISLYEKRNNILPKSQVGIVNIGSQSTPSQNRKLDRFRSSSFFDDSQQVRLPESTIVVENRDEDAEPESSIEVTRVLLEPDVSNSENILLYEPRIVDKNYSLEKLPSAKNGSHEAMAQTDALFSAEEEDDDLEGNDNFDDINPDSLDFPTLLQSPLKERSTPSQQTTLGIESRSFPHSHAPIIENPNDPKKNNEYDSSKITKVMNSVGRNDVLDERKSDSRDSEMEESDSDTFFSSKSSNGDENEEKVTVSKQSDKLDTLADSDVNVDRERSEQSGKHCADQLQGVQITIHLKTENPKTFMVYLSPPEKPSMTLASVQDITEAMEIRKEDFNNMEIVGQFNSGFIIVTHDHKLFIVDQHALDEIYNYERLMNDLTLKPQPLVAPQILELSPIDEMKILEFADHLGKNGFAIEEVEDAAPGRRVKLMGIPVLKNVVFDISDLHELVHKLHEQGAGIASRSKAKQGVETKSRHALSTCRCTKVDRMIALRACRLSIMIGLALSKQTMSKVVKNLAGLDRPWNCPHGRPTMRHLADLQGTGFTEDYEL